MARLTSFGERLSVYAHPLFVGLLGVGLFAVVYPLLAEQTQYPLAIFVVPILLTSALGTGRDALIVAAAAFSVAVLEGALQPGLDSSALFARLFVVLSAAALGVAVAVARQRHQLAIAEANARALLAEVFQSSLTPVPVPPEGITVHVRFIPGDERFQLGGDFFDAIRLPTGHLGYVIGDVCGSGPSAAGFGAAVRSGWKSLATVHPDDPVVWVAGLDATFFRLGRHADTYVTLNTGILELADHRLCFVSAGHPWPLMISDDPVMLRPHVGPPLGIGISGGWRQNDVVVPRNATLMLYTDGLTENRLPDGGRSDGEQRLIHYVKRAGPDLDVDEMLRHFGPDGYDDDVAVLTLRFT